MFSYIATVHRYSLTYGTECTHIGTVHRYSVTYCTECTRIATVHRYNFTYCTECTHIPTDHRYSVTYGTECIQETVFWRTTASLSLSAPPAGAEGCGGTGPRCRTCWSPLDRSRGHSGSFCSHRKNTGFYSPGGNRKVPVTRTKTVTELSSLTDRFKK